MNTQVALTEIGHYDWPNCVVWVWQDLTRIWYCKFRSRCVQIEMNVTISVQLTGHYHQQLLTRLSIIDRISRLASTPVCSRLSGFGNNRFHKIISSIHAHSRTSQSGKAISEKIFTSHAKKDWSNGRSSWLHFIKMMKQFPELPMLWTLWNHQLKLFSDSSNKLL